MCSGTKNNTIAPLVSGTRLNEWIVASRYSTISHR